jgi:hypothetical protein
MNLDRMPSGWHDRSQQQLSSTGRKTLEVLQLARPIMSQYRHIHTALGGEMLKVEQHAASLDPNDPAAVGAFVGHLRMIRGILDIHAHEEENGAWPMIEARLPGITHPYLLDHEQERALFAEIDADLAALQQGAARDRNEIGRRLYRNVVAVVSHLTHHMSKEELHPYAAFVETLSPDEELQIITAVLNGIPDQALAMAMPWQASFLTDEELIDDIDVYLQTLGPEKQSSFIAPLAKGLPAERWQKLVTARPQIAGFAG